MKNIYLFVIACMAAIAFTGCKGEPDLTETMSTLRFANITDAKSLFVTGGATQSKSGDEKEESKILYKVTGSGASQKVVFTDAAGNPIPAKTNYVLNLSEKFIVLNLGVESKNHPFGAVYIFIVRKSDGAMFAPVADDYISPLHYLFYGLSADYESLERLQQMPIDKDGNVYFLYSMGMAGVIYKIHDDASGNVFVTSLTSPKSMTVFNYVINKNGDAWFGYDLPGSSNSNTSFCRLASGELIRAPGHPYSRVFLLPSQDHNFYLLGRYWDPDSNKDMWTLNRYTAQQPEMKKEIAATGEIKKSIDGPSGSGPNVAQLSDRSVIVFGDAVCVIRSESDVQFFYDVAFPANKTNKPYLSSGKYLCHYDDRGNIVRFDTDNGKLETVYSNTEYQIKSLRSYSNDAILFAAIELKTGNDVLVEVQNGVAKVLDYIDGHRIIQLERIN